MRDSGKELGREKQTEEGANRQTHSEKEEWVTGFETDENRERKRKTTLTKERETDLKREKETKTYPN